MLKLTDLDEAIVDMTEKKLSSEDVIDFVSSTNCPSFGVVTASCLFLISNVATGYDSPYGCCRR